MTPKDYYKIINCFQEKIKQNKNSITKLNKKHVILEENSRSSRVKITVLLFIVLYLPTLLLLYFPISNVILANTLSVLFITIPLAAAVIAEHIFSKKAKKKLELFTKPLTQQELLEEKIKVEIEKSQLFNHNAALEDAISQIAKKINVLDSISSDCEIKRKEEARSKKEIEDSISNKNEFLQKKSNQLKKQLARYFINTYLNPGSKITRIIKVFLTSILTGLFTTLSLTGPLFMNSTFPLTYIISIPLLTGITIGAIYEIKNQKDKLLVFKKISETYGISPNQENDKYSEEEDILEKTQELIQDISNIYGYLEKEKIKLENKKEQPKPSYSYTYDESKTFTPTIPQIKEDVPGSLRKIKEIPNQN